MAGLTFAKCNASQGATKLWRHNLHARLSSTHPHTRLMLTAVFSALQTSGTLNALDLPVADYQDHPTC